MIYIACKRDYKFRFMCLYNVWIMLPWQSLKTCWVCYKICLFWRLCCIAVKVAVGFTGFQFLGTFCYNYVYINHF